jgi:hypothetical protein
MALLNRSQREWPLAVVRGRHDLFRPVLLTLWSQPVYIIEAGTLQVLLPSYYLPSRRTTTSARSGALLLAQRRIDSLSKLGEIR